MFIADSLNITKNRVKKRAWSCSYHLTPTYSKSTVETVEKS